MGSGELHEGIDKSKNMLLPYETGKMKRGREYGIEKSNGVLSSVRRRGPVKGSVYSLCHIGGTRVAATNTVLHS